MSLRNKLKLLFLFGRKKNFIYIMRGYHILKNKEILYLPNLIKFEISKKKIKH